MTRSRKRRPTFSGSTTAGSPFHQSIFDSSDTETSMSPPTSRSHTQRRGSKFGPSTFVERWIRRNSSNESERPMSRHHHSENARSGAAHSHSDDDDLDNDFGVGIPIDDYPSRRSGDLSEDSSSSKSKPSTRRSSIDSSIDDVCMPLDDEVKQQAATVWPDTEVLDEFAAKEVEEQASAEAAELVRESVNEAADAVKGGRSRPRYAPWERNTVSKSQANMRFTYFRDDLEATIHSPSIAGSSQPGQTFADSFPQPQESGPSATDSFVQGVVQSAAHGAAQGAANATQAAQFPFNERASPAPGPSTKPPFAQQPFAQPPFAQQGPAPAPAPAPTPPPPVPHAAKPAESATASPQPTASIHQHGAQQQGAQQHGAESTASSASGAVGEKSGPPGPAVPPRTDTESPSVSIDPGPKENFPDIQPTSNATKMKKLSRESSETAPSSEAGSDMGPWWLDINSPTEDEMRVSSRAFGIHPSTAEDIILHETREKVELFHNYYFVCFTSFDVKAWESGSGPTGADDDTKAFTEDRKRRGSVGQRSSSSSRKRHRRGARIERLKPLAVFSIVFKTGIITVHYRPTPHTINVRRRIRSSRDYLNVSSDWISYALIDDITDGYGPLISAVDEDVQGIEDAILKMHGSHSDSEDESDDEKSMADSRSSGSSSTGYREWREKGNMSRWIGESRKRVMSSSSSLSNKADVIKGFAKRVSDHWSGAPRSEIAMYLSDIQDHLVTMTQSLNHYEKSSARSHSNYLAQINIDMTRTNNEMNDVLGKISVLGTIVSPMNIVTGLWGMNVLVPGQRDEDSLAWFWSITIMMSVFGISAYFLIMRFV